MEIPNLQEDFIEDKVEEEDIDIGLIVLIMGLLLFLNLIIIYMCRRH